MRWAAMKVGFDVRLSNQLFEMHLNRVRDLTGIRERMSAMVSSGIGVDMALGLLEEEFIRVSVWFPRK